MTSSEELPVSIAQAFLGEIFSILGYALLIAAVYKLFQIGADLGEIKTLLMKSGKAPASDPVMPVAVGDSAAEYAQNLLRSVSAETRRTEN